MASQTLLDAFAAAKVETITPAVWNSILQTLEVRLKSVEDKKASFDDAVRLLQEIGLARVNDVLAPAMASIAGLTQLGAIFTATSSTAVTIGLGVRQFTIDAANRDRFAPAAYLMVRSNQDTTAAMLASFAAYDRPSGTLTVNVDYVAGDGNFSAWTITPAAAPNLGHEARTDNPHEVTAAQVGAWTIEQTSAAISDAMAPVAAALANRLQTDTDAQGLNSTEKSNALTNLGASSVGKALIAAVDKAAGRTALGLGAAATKDVGTGANNVIQLDGASHIPAALLAVKADAEAGTDADKLMTPARTAEAIAALAKAGWEQIGTTQTLGANTAYIEQSWTPGVYKQFLWLMLFKGTSSSVSNMSLRSSSSEIKLIPSGDISTAFRFCVVKIATYSAMGTMVEISTSNDFSGFSGTTSTAVDRIRHTPTSGQVAAGTVVAFFGMR